MVDFQSMDLPPRDTSFLVDANLPYYFSLWNSDDYVHQFDIDPKASDEEIWLFARDNDLTIITKDSDFSNRLMLYGAPPKLIHIRLGNMSVKDLYRHLEKNWIAILELNRNNRLVNVFKDRLEAVE